MGLWTWVYKYVFCNSTALLLTFCMIVLVLCLCGGISLVLHHSGYTLSCVFFVMGINIIVLFTLGIALQNAKLYFAISLCVCGIAYASVLISISIRDYVAQRKEELNLSSLSACYTLPARENGFVRERLNTVLRQTEDEGEVLKISFSYAREMLIKLKNEKLALSDSLEVEELSRLYALYTKKDNLTTEDVNVLNEAFARMLKLSAKHAVTVR